MIVGIHTRQAHPARWLPGRRADAPEPVDAGEQPCLGAQHAGEPEQDQRRESATGPLDLEHGRPHDERHERGVDVAAGRQEGEIQTRGEQQRGKEPDDWAEQVATEPVEPDQQHHHREDADRDPDAIAHLTQQREHPADEVRERMFGRRQVRVEGRRLEMHDLAAPEERVDRVVVRVGREQEEPTHRDQGQQRDAAAFERGKARGKRGAARVGLATRTVRAGTGGSSRRARPVG